VERGDAFGLVPHERLAPNSLPFTPLTHDGPIRSCWVNAPNAAAVRYGQYRLKIVRGDRDEVKVKGGLLLVALSSRPNSRRVKELVRAWYKKKAKARFLDRFEAIAPRFARLGCLISPPAIRKMPRRWGSYSKSGKVLLNPDLIRAPTSCIDYVITHELAHIVYPNHGAKFFELIER
jgi:predicted metal-dependent hydrolase